ALLVFDEERRQLAIRTTTCPGAPRPADSAEDAAAAGGRLVVLPSGFSAPLFARDRTIGVVSVRTLEPRAFSDDEIGFVEVVAGQAAIALENARLLSETEEMKRTLETRKLVERAKGILQYKYQLTEEEAYLRLRNESRRLRRPMRDLAEAIILADDINKSALTG
ncbi:MAG: ANTAR domain-containing protein, partial [Bryobacteraceae bacterium]